MMRTDTIPTPALGACRTIARRTSKMVLSMAARTIPAALSGGSPVFRATHITTRFKWATMGMDEDVGEMHPARDCAHRALCVDVLVPGVRLGVG
mmetsp:Transcript_6335/g.15304  ORF Transcript_6335/g.15304 Transcript_6335/m.15304 type:complete len:94 (-) Transcript_6335:13-294(-)